jgi:endogenous inhibitor of DNA gyrase (YacG/DUF329 family)
MPASIDLTGKPFGLLVAESQARTARGRRGWLCRCACGGVKIVETAKLTGHIVRSCGCLEATNRITIGDHHPAAPVAINCPGCGRALDAHPNTVYCSLRCKARVRRGWTKERYCRNCGVVYYLAEGQSRKRVYCSDECETVASSALAYARRNGTLGEQLATVKSELEGRLRDAE